jgi:carboxymethylenebutenolidase
MCRPGEEEIGVTRRALVGGGAALSALALAGVPADAQERPPPPTRVIGDPSVEQGPITMAHAAATAIGGYLARPKRAGRFPGILVVAGNRITEEYIPNTCVALARAGYAALAPDVFHPLPPDAPQADYGRYLDGHSELNRLDDIGAGMSYLRAQPFVSAGGMGVLGFCRGGREALLFGERMREIDAVVAYHPAPTRAEELPRLDAPILIHHGTADTSVAVANSRTLAAALRRRRRAVSFHEYAGAEHGFLAYTRIHYRADHAILSWQRTLAFLRRSLTA